MPLYISNTNRIETLQGVQGRGINSTTTTTLVPPANSFWWAKTGDFQSGSFGGQVFYTISPVNWTVSGPGKWTPANNAINWDTDNPPPLVSNNFGMTPYGDTNKNTSISIWRSPYSSSFSVTPSIFGKVTTFTNPFASGSGKWMLASYVAWSGSDMTYEFVPPSSSIERCITYPYLANLAAPMSGGYGDTSYIAPLDASAFGADCQYDTYCECIYCYLGDSYTGGPTLSSGSQPCQQGGTTTTTSTTSTSTTSTTSTSTTSTTSTTTAPVSSSYQVEYLIVAGGGAGGPATATGLTGTGGGGAGGFISSSLFVTASNAYSIVVGSGGTGYSGDTLAGNNGSDSSVFGFTALGGGGGASQSGDAGNGGSGGGGASRGSGNPVRLAGSGSSSQGNNGGVATAVTNGPGGGGGGASTAGSTPGAGLFEGGGLGKLWLDGTTYSAGGNAKGSGTGTQAAVNATANTGNGGGGVKTNTTVTAGGNGGSGIVAIRYVSGSASATGGTIVNAGGYTYHYFTGSGTFTA